MYTVTEIAKKCGVSSQAIYKRINGNLSEALAGHIHKGRGGKTLIDEEGAAILCDRVGPNAPEVPPEAPADGGEQAQGGTSAAGSVSDSDTLALIRETIAQLRAENAELRGQLETERTAARAQAERTLTLAERLAELTANSQVLLKQQQEAQRLPERGGGYAAAQEVPYTAHETEPAPEQTQPQQPQESPEPEARRGFFAKIFGK